MTVINNQSLADSIYQFKADSFPELVVRPIKLLLFKASSKESVDNQYVIDLLGIYLKRRPLDANAWLIASQFYQRINDVELSSRALAVAHRLSETNTVILLKVFNRYLELGLIEQALPVAHDIVYARPYEFRRLFYLMGRLNKDYSRVVKEMIPAKVPAVTKSQKTLTSNAYFSWALTDAINAENTALVQAIWKAMPAEFKSGSRLGVNYINYLVDLQSPSLLEPVWSQVVGSEIKVAELLNQSDSSFSSPCWQVKSIGGVDLVFDVDSGMPLFQLMFLGEANIGYSHLTCVVRVEPGKQYVLKGRSKGQDITTLSGPFLDLYYPNIESTYNRTEAMIGTWDWTDFQLNLNVPKDAYFAKIRIRRKKTRLLDSKISGSVWFEGVRLETVQ